MREATFKLEVDGRPLSDIISQVEEGLTERRTLVYVDTNDEGDQVLVFEQANGKIQVVDATDQALRSARVAIFRHFHKKGQAKGMKEDSSVFS